MSWCRLSSPIPVYFLLPPVRLSLNSPFELLWLLPGWAEYIWQKGFCMCVWSDPLSFVAVALNAVVQPPSKESKALAFQCERLSCKTTIYALFVKVYFNPLCLFACLFERLLKSFKGQAGQFCLSSMCVLEDRGLVLLSAGHQSAPTENHQILQKQSSTRVCACVCVCAC